MRRWSLEDRVYEEVVTLGQGCMRRWSHEDRVYEEAVT